MERLDPFSSRLVEMVRNLPDDALLALVRHHLEVATEKVATTPSSGAPRSGRGRKPRQRRRRSAARQEALAKVEETIRASRGLSAREVAAATGIPQPRAARLIRTLKKEGRIHQHGDRRFARYAGDAATARAASEHARRTAAGPVRRR